MRAYDHRRLPKCPEDVVQDMKDGQHLAGRLDAVLALARSHSAHICVLEELNRSSIDPIKGPVVLLEAAEGREEVSVTPRELIIEDGLVAPGQFELGKYACQGTCRLVEALGPRGQES